MGTLKYISINKDLNSKDLDTDIHEFDCLDLLDLAIYWGDEKMKKQVEKWLENNINANLISEIYDHPILKDHLKQMVLKQFSILEGKNKKLSADLSVEKKKNKREFFWFETTDNGLKVYSGMGIDMTGRTPIYKIRAITSLKKLMNAYCHQQNLVITKTCFELDEQILLGSSTAETLDLQDGDEIIVTEVEVSDAHLK